MNSLDEQKAFADKQSLRFPLLADPDRTVSMAYGACTDSDGIATRCTVVIGQDGAVHRVYPQASARGHAEQVLDDLRV